MPSSVLFIGEAPGHSEDAVGKPFIGRSGGLLRNWLTQLNIDLGRKLPSWSIANAVCCLPEVNGKIVPPTKDQMSACRPHLLEFLDLASPKLVVLLGNSAKSAWKPVAKETEGEYRTLELKHPAWFLRQGINADMSFKDCCHRCLEYKRCYHRLRDEFKRLMKSK